MQDFEPLVTAAVSAGLSEREAARTVLSAQRTVGGAATRTAADVRPVPAARARL